MSPRISGLILFTVALISILLPIVAGMSTELASYQDDRYARLAKRRTAKEMAAKKVTRKKG